MDVESAVIFNVHSSMIPYNSSISSKKHHLLSLKGLDIKESRQAFLKFVHNSEREAVGGSVNISDAT